MAVCVCCGESNLLGSDLTLDGCVYCDCGNYDDDVCNICGKAAGNLIINSQGKFCYDCYNQIETAL